MAMAQLGGNDEAVQQKRAGVLAYQLDFLKLEFQGINDSIGRIDETTAKIKNWTIVTWAGSIGLLLRDPQLRRFLWLTAVPPLLFFFVDAWWRRIQRTFIFRIQKISEFLNSDNLLASFEEQRIVGLYLLDPRAKQFSKSSDYQAFASVVRTMRFKEVAAFYVGLSLLSVALWWILSFASGLKT